MLLIFLGLFSSQISLAGDVKGHIDEVFERNGNTIIRGWACVSSINASIYVHAYAGANYWNNGQFMASTFANKYTEGAVNQACGTSAVWHRFEFNINKAIADSHKDKLIYIHGINPYGGANLTIGDSGRYRMPIDPLTKMKSSRVKKILWVAAHPDDEIIISPLLGEVCKMPGKSCSFVLANSGYKGVCYKDNGGNSNCGQLSNDTIRRMEMRASVDYIEGTGENLEIHHTKNGFTADEIGIIESDWNTSVTGSYKNYIKNKINEVKPDIIITHDPRHGTTCHPEHRVIGDIVYRVVKESPFMIRNDAYVVTNRRVVVGGKIGLDSANTVDPSNWQYNANTSRLPYFGNITGWNFLTNVVSKHPSQFNAPLRYAIATVPAENRRISLQSMANYANTNSANEAIYEKWCADYTPYNNSK